MASKKREHLVKTALELFYKDGFHSTGIDKILRESGVAKMTLYKHFRSKDDLILAALQERDRQFREWFVKELESMAKSPQEKLLATFDVLELWFQGDFRGCMFINASAEFSDKNEDIHRFSGEHKKLMIDYLTEIAKAAEVPDPATLAFQLSVLMEGAIVLAHVCEDNDSAMKAKVAARILIDSAMSTP